MEALRRCRRWFRLLLRRRRHRVVAIGVVGRGLVVGRDIVKVRTVGMIMTVAILIRVSTIYVRRAHDDLCGVTYGVSVGWGSSPGFDVYEIFFHIFQQQ